MKTCRSCAFRKEDRGIYTATGWSRSGDGFCYADKKPIRRRADDPACLAHREESNG